MDSNYERVRPLYEEILRLEASVTPRRQREAILGMDNGWLAGIEAQIAALRDQARGRLVDGG